MQGEAASPAERFRFTRTYLKGVRVRIDKWIAKQHNLSNVDMGEQEIGIYLASSLMAASSEEFTFVLISPHFANCAACLSGFGLCARRRSKSTIAIHTEPS